MCKFNAVSSYENHIKKNKCEEFSGVAFKELPTEENCDVYLKNINKQLDGLSATFKSASDSSSVYCLYNTGNMLRINIRDWTYFTYFTNIWNGSAVGYNKNKNTIISFGGLYGQMRDNTFTSSIGRKPYIQSGHNWVPRNISCTIDGNGFSASQLSHNGLLEYDLNLTNLSTSSITNYIKDNNIQVIDYNETRDYLLELVNKYLNTTNKTQHPDTVTAIKQKLYLSTQTVLDDLSQLDILQESGERPHDRAFTQNAMIEDRLYIFGGCEVGKTQNCPASTINEFPFLTTSIGRGLGYNETQLSQSNKTAYYYDSNERTWTQIASMPRRRYMGSTIVSTDNRYIYMVGGATTDLCQTPTNSILVYDTLNNTYEEIKGIPTKCDGRLMPILRWVDDEKLLIMYGINVFINKSSCDTSDNPSWGYTTYPIQNAWIYDIRNNIIYKSWEDINGTIGIVVKDNYTGNSFDTERKMLVLNPYPRITDLNSTTNFVEPAIFINEVNLLNGETTTLKCIPDTEIFTDYSPFGMTSTDLTNAQKSIKLELTNTDNDSMLRKLYLKTVLSKSNFRFRYAWTEKYGLEQHKHMFVIGERLASSTETGIEFIKMMTMGYTQSHLRFWLVDLEAPEELRYMRQIKYSYPPPMTSPIMTAYDGIRYIYFIWNKNIMYRLDFKGVLSDPNASWWYKLPPILNADWLTDDEIKMGADGISNWNAFFLPPRYLCMVSRTGKIARMDTETFAWFIDKRIKPESPIPTTGNTNVIEYCATNYDDNEIYKLYLGGIGGKYLNLHYRQWDNFFFDLRAIDQVVKYMKDFVEENLYPVVVKRKRLYLQNHLGHMFYSWIRIDGEYDVEYSMNDFYDAQKVRIYTDYEGVDQMNNFTVSVFSLKKGWSIIPKTEYFSVMQQTDWGWDGEYTRRYVRDFISNGSLSREYTKIPEIYIDVPILSKTAGEPISKVKIKFSTENKEFNYITRINKVDVIDTTNEIVVYDNISGIGSQLDIVHLEPVSVNDDYTITFILGVKNIESYPLNDCYAYMVSNKWLQFSITGAENSFVIATEKEPFRFADSIEPNIISHFYVRGLNIDNKPHIGDIVIKGYYPVV